MIKIFKNLKELFGTCLNQQRLETLLQAPKTALLLDGKVGKLNLWARVLDANGG